MSILACNPHNKSILRVYDELSSSELVLNSSPPTLPIESFRNPGLPFWQTHWVKYCTLQRKYYNSKIGAWAVQNWKKKTFTVFVHHVNENIWILSSVIFIDLIWQNSQMTILPLHEKIVFFFCSKCLWPLWRQSNEKKK